MDIYMVTKHLKSMSHHQLHIRIYIRICKAKRRYSTDIAMEVINLTANQINYQKLQEDKRHNVSTEGETNRHNVATEELAERELKETVRHNTVSEGVAIFNANENKRHNLEGEKENNRHNVQTENLGWANYFESNRHNQQTEQLGWANLAETNRANLAREAENTRTNTINENIEAYNAITKRYVVDPNKLVGSTLATTTYGSDPFNPTGGGLVQAASDIASNSNSIFDSAKGILRDTAEDLSPLISDLTQGLKDTWSTIKMGASKVNDFLKSERERSDFITQQMRNEYVRH